jgi:hypothetical protein
MVKAAQVLAEQRPMLAEFLRDIGVAAIKTSPNLRALLPAFGRWLRQSVSSDDVGFLAARLGAYICLYMIDHHGAASTVVDNRIVLQVPCSRGIVREFEPYGMAQAIASSCTAGQRVDFTELLLALT